jgi:YVTN family beta-propeller protein
MNVPVVLWRIAVLGCLAAIVAGCSPSSTAPPPTSGSPTPLPSAATATEGPTAVPATPSPTLDLPALQDIVDAGARPFQVTPSPDFAIIAASNLVASGIDKGIGMVDATGKVVASWTIPGDTCGAFDVSDAYVWSATCGPGGPGLVAIAIEGQGSPPTSVELGSTMPDSESSIGVADETVWIVITAFPRQLVKVDARTFKVLARYEIPGSVTAVRAGLGGVWIADVANNAIVRFDPMTEAVVATIEVGKRPQFLAVGEGAVWVMNQLDGTVSRIDPASNTVAATIAVGEPIEGGDIAVGGGYVWLRGSNTLLFKIDPATNAVVARYGPSSGSGSVAADDDAVWITAHDITTVWRLPLR